MIPQNISIHDFVIKFEQLYQKAEFYKTENLYGVLACRLLNIANLSTDQKQFVRATVNEIEYSVIKDQQKKYLPP